MGFVLVFWFCLLRLAIFVFSVFLPFCSSLFPFESFFSRLVFQLALMCLPACSCLAVSPAVFTWVLVCAKSAYRASFSLSDSYVVPSTLCREPPHPPFHATYYAGWHVVTRQHWRTFGALWVTFVTRAKSVQMLIVTDSTAHTYTRTGAPVVCAHLEALTAVITQNEQIRGGMHGGHRPRRWSLKGSSWEVEVRKEAAMPCSQALLSFNVQDIRVCVISPPKAQTDSFLCTGCFVRWLWIFFPLWPWHLLLLSFVRQTLKHQREEKGYVESHLDTFADIQNIGGESAFVLKAWRSASLKAGVGPHPDYSLLLVGIHI